MGKSKPKAKTHKPAAKRPAPKARKRAAKPAVADRSPLITHHPSLITELPPAPESRSTPPPAILLMGPTASGKTAVATRLMEALPGEIISVDTAQIYKGMNIGTAKPDAELLKRAPHHLLDVIEPHESYSAARFRDDALALMREITERDHIPL